MPVQEHREVSTVQDEVFELIRRLLPEDRAVLAEFLTVRCFADLYAGEESGLDAEKIFGAVSSLLAFMRHREPGEIQLRVFNPTLKEHGWQSDYTVVQIINDDMPFLVDSVVAELLSQGCVVHTLLHPVVRVLRNKRRIVTAFAADKDRKGSTRDGKTVMQGNLESIIFIEIDRRTNDHALDALGKQLLAILGDIKTVVADWQPMQIRTQEITDELDTLPSSVSHERLDEYKAFFNWLAEKHFVFLGCRDYEFREDADGNVITPAILGSGLGILRDPERKVFEEAMHQPHIPARALSFLKKPQAFYLTKAGRVSSIHRRARMDVIGVKCFDKKGQIVKVRLIVGLFASLAYSSPPESIPILREKIARTLELADLRPDSHNGKTLLHILQTFPREELFLYHDDQLLKTVLGVLSAQQHRRAALFVRTDDFDRYVSCLVYVPRDGYDTSLRTAIAGLLTQVWSGTLETYHALVAESPLARLHFTIQIPLGQQPSMSIEELEARIAAISKPWSEGLGGVLMHAYGEELGARLIRRYSNAFPASFRESFPPEAALSHIACIEKVFLGSSFELKLTHEAGSELTSFRLNLYHPQVPVPLSDALPVLENLGFRVISEHPHHVRFENPSESIWIQDILLETENRSIPHPGTLCQRLEEAFLRVWKGDAENDRFNRLVLFAGLEWRTVVLLRAYAKYLRQVRAPFSQEIIIEALTASPETSALLMRLFDARFNPQQTLDETDALKELEKSLYAIDSPDYDRIFRRFLNLIQFTLRTNFYQKRDGQPKNYISFKLDTRNLDAIPSPRPWVEVWVYSPRVEAVHLRVGKVARGGIRWSDHREDFRTEIVGLLKPQIVKNTVTVSVGAKGGFVVKAPPVGREALLLEGIECYRTMMYGLLDITDNLEGDIVIPPPDVVRMDGDDPYLVVAAEKGTSSFSDIANTIAFDYKYWLGDAFASSGSFGYSRRTIGITARGAWESAKRHFREMDIDAETEDFTVVGVGDMSGDVFGNGMLRSPHIQLVAAFNHMHIFLDPNPVDTYASFNERLRLFRTPYSQWNNYDPSLISTGGGVFSRNTKSIPISPQVKERFGIEEDVLSSAELIKVLLRAQVNMLWFGGIGTYVRATTESDIEVDDANNDTVRINARELRCQVIVEGGSLGLTQKARIEYARNGGRINTDAIDNSAGVDLSDHEVNIKILLNDVMVTEGMTQAERNEVFLSTTDEACALVLRDNYLQTQQISSAEKRAPALLPHHARLIRSLEKAGRLDRSLVSLPDEDDIAERLATGRGLTRPEIAMLLSYAKLDLFDKLVSSDFPDDPFLTRELLAYFPTVLHEKYAPYMDRHWLRREIIATRISNEMINRCGISIIPQIEERTGFAAPDIARAFVIACSTFDLSNMWDAIEAMDMIVSPDTQIFLLHATERLLEQSIIRILHRGNHPLDIAAYSQMYSAHVSSLFATLPTLLSADMADVLQTTIYDMESQGTSTALARRTARFAFLASVPDIADLCTLTASQTTDVARCYFNVASLFGLNGLRGNIARLFEGDHWQRLAASALSDDLVEIQHRLTRIALRDPPGLLAAARRYHQISAEFKDLPVLDLATLTVACRQLASLSA